MCLSSSLTWGKLCLLFFQVYIHFINTYPIKTVCLASNFQRIIIWWLGRIAPALESLICSIVLFQFWVHILLGSAFFFIFWGSVKHSFSSISWSWFTWHQQPGEGLLLCWLGTCDFSGFFHKDLLSAFSIWILNYWFC